MMNKSVIEELNKLAKDGRLTPRDVIDAAQSVQNPLHQCFEWNDEIAADQHRLYQARKLISSVTVKVTTDNVSHSVPSYVRDPGRPGNEQGYIAVSTVRSKHDVAKEVMLAELQRIEAHLARAESLSAYFSVEGKIEDVKMRLKLIEDEVKNRVAEAA